MYTQEALYLPYWCQAESKLFMKALHVIFYLRFKEAGVMGRIVQKIKLKIHSNSSLSALLRIHSLLKVVLQKYKCDLISVNMDNPIHFSGVAANCSDLYRIRIRICQKTSLVPVLQG